MYSVSVSGTFTAQHFLVGGDWGRENEPHSHVYEVTVRLEGATLDRNGYLVDIVAVEGALAEVITLYRGATLNDLPPFQSLNPSIEHFSRILCDDLLARIGAGSLSAVTVSVAESSSASASYTRYLDAPGSHHL